ncbi:hypothetical protein CDL12_21026 [Handroanthus impetiginosus]|uniref:DUF309 domain-containing protein n=1 Tax=Handroanthus impetiginosus TaxID=429701 RepID=A0A2G9GMC9_9LAMI|nr:hypothetical protein CDL12_21026 [Handroanthus impetiginosus]
MAALSISLLSPNTHPSSNKLTKLLDKETTNFTCSSSFFNPRIHYNSTKPIKFSIHSYRITTRGGFTDEQEEEEEESCSFNEAVSLFNKGDYYKCHDLLETLWNKSQEPTRTLVHGILQCAVGFHHLFNQNHRGAMMELGEGLCKLRKMNFENGPFHQFEKEISAVLEFIYQTQLEQAACTDELCVAMDQSERSYQLLGCYGAGERLYHLEVDRSWNAYIVFCPDKYRAMAAEPPSIKIPVLKASEENMMDLEYF